MIGSECLQDRKVSSVLELDPNSELMLLIIVVLLGFAITLGGVIGKMMIGRLDRMGETTIELKHVDDEQWKVIRLQERELGAHEALLKLGTPPQISGGE